MSLDNVEKVMRGKRILIIEDDDFLARKLAELLKQFTLEETIIAHSVEAAKNLLEGKTVDFDLAVVDVMLPDTEQDYKEIQEFREKMEQLAYEIKKIEQASDHSGARERLSQARYQRSLFHERIFDRVKEEGGIELVQTWVENRSKTTNKLFPVLFLSALGNQNVISKVERIEGLLEKWIVKPVEEGVLLTECSNLLIGHTK
jgi:DNA-binding response OmpR family regulator